MLKTQYPHVVIYQIINIIQVHKRKFFGFLLPNPSPKHYYFTPPPPAPPHKMYSFWTTVEHQLAFSIATKFWTSAPYKYIYNGVPNQAGCTTLTTTLYKTLLIGLWHSYLNSQTGDKNQACQVWWPWLVLIHCETATAPVATITGWHSVCKLECQSCWGLDGRKLSDTS